MSHPNAFVTWQARAAAARHRLRRIAALINEYDELADGTCNTDLAILANGPKGKITITELHPGERGGTQCASPTQYAAAQSGWPPGPFR